MDISSLNGRGQSASPPVPGTSSSDPAGKHDNMHGRPWLAIHWKCCSVYSRVYRNASGDAYEGKCPRCGRAVKVRVGSGGTDSRFFTAE
ncbi:MAG: hypothetical protein GC164_01015 [Phycisphaera sp.]|nr:hypothetical protein [Phycisphaera sp.]